MENGWVKHFVDGSSYVGTDKDVRAKRASWRNSRLIGMTSCCIRFNSLQGKIEGYGDYWQSDSYEVSFSSGTSILTKRRIQKKIDCLDKYFSFTRNDSSVVTVSFNKLLGVSVTEITNSFHDKWFTVEMDLKQGLIRTYIMDNKA